MGIYIPNMDLAIKKKECSMSLPLFRKRDHEGALTGKKTKNQGGTPAYKFLYCRRLILQVNGLNEGGLRVAKKALCTLQTDDISTE
jgi:hypothetical protein